jgi:hypothetical protein
MYTPGADDEDVDDEGEIEVEIHFEPHPGVLQRLGLSEDQFEEALMEALEVHEAQAASATDEASLPAFEDITLTINGETHRLGDLAEVTISADFDEDDSDDED